MKEILFPIGRLVGGSLYKGETKDSDGKPLTFADGSPRTQFSFAVAYPKGAETHWNQTEWGRLIWAEGAEAAPNIHQTPSFAWKVKDGDSTIPNKKGNKPCDQEGFRGHWVVWYSGSYAPKIFNRDGTQPIIEADAVKPGYYVQVFGSVAYNKRNDSPGVYMNFNLVAFSAYGQEIELTSTPDASAVGFGGGALPAGATAAPVGGMNQPPVTQTAPPPAATSDAPPPPHTGYMDPPAPPHTGYMDPPAPPVVQFPPEGWKANPNGPGWFYNVANPSEQLKEADLRARFGA